MLNIALYSTAIYRESIHVLYIRVTYESLSLLCAHIVLISTQRSAKQFPDYDSNNNSMTWITNDLQQKSMTCNWLIMPKCQLTPVIVSGSRVANSWNVEFQSDISKAPCGFVRGVRPSLQFTNPCQHKLGNAIWCRGWLRKLKRFEFMELPSFLDDLEKTITNHQLKLLHAELIWEIICI